MTATPAILGLDPLGDHRYAVRQPDEPPEGRDVVFSGLLIGHMLMASEAEATPGKVARSVHTIFARAGVYSQPLDLDVESMQAGRTWASDSVTARQGGKLIARSLVLLHSPDRDMMRHGTQAPESLPRPDELHDASGQVMPGAQWRPVPGNAEEPALLAWHRFESSPDSVAANQAVLAWATCGDVIGLAMRPHRGEVSIADAHRTISTGVIAQTIHFLEPFDVGQWLLFSVRGTSAGNGRVYGEGSVFDESGSLVATFHQDSMAKALDAPVDPRTAL